MTNLKVRIIRLWDLGWYPGWAECVLVDAFGVEHRFRDKIPVASRRNITPEDVPCDGVVRCTKEADHLDGTVTVNTQLPDDIESTAGEHLFRVFPSQLTDGEVFP